MIAEINRVLHKVETYISSIRPEFENCTASLQIWSSCFNLGSDNACTVGISLVLPIALACEDLIYTKILEDRNEEIGYAHSFCKETKEEKHEFIWTEEEKTEIVALGDELARIVRVYSKVKTYELEV